MAGEHLGTANEPTARVCVGYGCTRLIHECMGAVKAGDFLEAIDGRRCVPCVRELCGRCMLRFRWARYSVLVTAEAPREREASRPQARQEDSR